MARFPISITRKSTQSRKPREQQKTREQNRAAELVEAHINRVMADLPEDTIQQFTHALLALDLKLDVEAVTPALMSVGGGSNGITVVKGDFDRALQRMAEA